MPLTPSGRYENECGHNDKLEAEFHEIKQFWKYYFLFLLFDLRMDLDYKSSISLKNSYQIVLTVAIMNFREINCKKYIYI